ncbi:MAG: succinylglutamate desuccinylase/aspartoacylase family protein [Kofleriaceae bacterium]
MNDEREIAALRGGADGATLIIVAGLHGNEAVGVEATRRVLERIQTERLSIKGQVLGLRGNVRALAAKRRYLARDLNRLWTPERVSAARAATSDPFTMPTLDGAELSELAELADAFDRVISAARGPVFVVDLHTTSAPGIPFSIVGSTPAHRAFARRFPMPGIAGIEELIEGVLTRYLGGKGCITVAIEGGQSDAPTTLANLEATVTIALAAAGIIELPALATAEATLVQARGELPTEIDVVSRHPVLPAHEFRMEPGFANIQRVVAGTLIASDRDGEIRAPEDGFVLLPLYQKQGSDGFFFGRHSA